MKGYEIHIISVSDFRESLLLSKKKYSVCVQLTFNSYGKLFITIKVICELLPSDRSKPCRVQTSQNSDQHRSSLPNPHLRQ